METNIKENILKKDERFYLKEKEYFFKLNNITIYNEDILKIQKSKK